MIIYSFPANAYYGTPYPFGVDPVWQVAENKIVFLNAFKMKLSIILGVTHMLFGIVLSYKNHKYFQRPLDIFTEFIPQTVFLMCLFGYMALLMFHKWVTYYATDDPVEYSEYCAPSILITFINMILWNNPDDPENKQYEEVCKTAFMYSGQLGLQRFLVIVAVFCVPIMLFAKPYITIKRHKDKMLRKAHLGSNANPDTGKK